MRRALPGILAAAAVISLTACGSAHLSDTAAIHAAMTSNYVKQGGFATWFLKAPGQKRCTIGVGGPSGGTLPALCRTQVVPAAHGVSIVRLRVEWYPHSVDTKRHFWDVRVSKQGKILGTREYGDPGPWEMA
jgi:hypothetical protein